MREIPAWLGLNTCNDPKLELLAETIGLWLQDIKREEPPRWLVLLGHSGTGKTMCARRLWKWIVKHKPFNPIHTEYVPYFVHWPTFVKEQLREQEYGAYRDMARWPFLVLDDIGAERDATGFSTEHLTSLLNHREFRWTIITSNLLLKEWDSVDARIADRLLRHNSRIVEITAESYQDRPAAQTATALAAPKNDPQDVESNPPVPSHYKTIKAVCRACGKRLVLPYDPTCPMEQVFKLATVAVCNECHDRHVRMTR